MKMKALERVGRLLLVAVVSTVLLSSAARVVSTAQAADSCHTIHAVGVGQDLGGGKTHAHLIGGGLVHGTTDGTFATTGAPPNLAIDGTVVVTTKHGTLTVHVTGHFNVVTGAFSAVGPVIGATGRLAGATGSLMLNGVENLSDGRFVEDVTGTICVDGESADD